MLVAISSACAIRAFDCRADKLLFAMSLDNTEVGKCKRTNPDTIEKIQGHVQLLKRMNVQTITAYSCKITAVRNLLYCGFLSHTSITDVNSTPRPIQISKEDCEKIISKGVFKYEDLVLRDIQPRATATKKIILKGKLFNDASCAGETFTLGERSFRNTIWQEELSITTNQEEATVDLRSNNIATRSGLHSKVYLNSSTTSDSTVFFWENNLLNKCAVNIIYEGTGEIRKGNATSEDLLIINNEQLALSALLKNTTLLCKQTVTATDHNDIFVAFTKGRYAFTTGKTQHIVIPDMDIPLYLSSKMNFMSSAMDINFRTIVAEISHRDCKEERKSMLQRFERAKSRGIYRKHVLTGETGFVTMRAGDSFTITKCKLVNVQIRVTEKCYHNLPIFHEDRPEFLEMESESITSYGAETPCSMLTPPSYNINGSWFVVHPKIIETKPPTLAQPIHTDNDINIITVGHLLNRGIYSHDTLEAFNKFLLTPAQDETAIKFIAKKFRTHTEDTEFRAVSILSPRDIDELSLSLIHKLDTSIRKIGAYMGLIFGVISIFQIVLSLIRCLMNAKAIYKNHGRSWKMLRAFSSFATIYTVLKSDKREQDPAGSEAPNIELVTQ